MNERIGMAIRKTREAKGMTQRDLERKIGASRGMVWYWEDGQFAPTAYFLCQMADALECSVDELLGRK